MIRRLSVVATRETEPYRNLALEEALLFAVEPEECFLYLWQNRKTVVIGRNQNAYAECRADALSGDGGFVARRLSGGGAVFHDLGNLNFTFLVRAEDYDVSRQLDVLLEALSSLGLTAEKSGRNDVTVEGKKVSGNAFYQTGDRCCHHGTVLIRTDREALSRYLTVSPKKLSAKGVASVQARVGNLCDFLPAVTLEQVRTSLCQGAGRVYGLSPEVRETDWARASCCCRSTPEELSRRRERFASWDWNFGRNIPFTWERSHRFVWGEITLRLCLEQGKVAKAQVLSDAMDADWIAALPEALQGCPFSPLELSRRVGGENPLSRELAAWLRAGD